MAQAKTGESTCDNTDLWTTESNNEATNTKTNCSCGKRWPQDKRAQCRHINTYHCFVTNFIKTFICPNCPFPGETVELVVEHNKIHTTNKNPTPRPSKKIKKKGVKNPQKVVTILTKISNKLQSLVKMLQIYQMIIIRTF